MAGNELPNPVVVVPGITGTVLRDEYDMGREAVWTMLGRRYDRMAPHPDDMRFEAVGPSRVAAAELFQVPYGEWVEEMRHNLSRRPDRPVPVHPFGYDWRRPLEEAEDGLAAFMDEVADRARLLPHYRDAGYGAAREARVDVAGHSMGGLVIAGMIARRGAGRIGRVATVGAPFRGSFEAVTKIATGLSPLGGNAPGSREREVARMTPALYYLLPSFAGAVEAARGLKTDLFDPAAWQPAVRDTLAEYVRLHGLKKVDRKGQADALMARMLGAARDHRARIEGLDLAAAGLPGGSRGWLCLAGMGETTRVRLEIGSEGGRPRFDLTSRWRLNEWDMGDAGRRTPHTGDGTVPYAGAVPAFVPEEEIVCLCGDDFGYWELGDRALEWVGGLHGLLPKMNLCHRLVVSHFAGRHEGSVWGRPAPGVSASAWRPPVPGLRAR